MARPLARTGPPPWLNLLPLALVVAAMPAHAGDESPPSVVVAANDANMSPAADRVEPAVEVPRVASTARSVEARPLPAAARADDPVAQAKRAIADCRERYRHVQDYTCTMFKRERIGGRLSSAHVMHMKARTRPQSVYLKFQTPKAGREAIYVAGRYKGKAIVHDVGLGKLLAGTLHLDPKSSFAMEDCRHPITEAGLGFLIDEVERNWERELTADESLVVIHPHAAVGDRACTLVETTHPEKRPDFMFHKVKLYVDHESGLPIRFEAYDWPHQPGAAAELVEEYTYTNLKLNVGLRDADFDPSNQQYSFGRF